MTITTPTTELEAVNAMLAAIGEAPINSLSQSGLVDAAIAQTILGQVSREVQSRGWQFNSEREYPLPAAVDGTVPLPTNTLQVSVASSQKSQFDLAWRAGKLYDRIAHTFVIGQTIKVDITFLLTFEDMPEAARWYVTMRAARQFISKTVGSDSLVGFELRDESDALAVLKEAEGETADHNILTGNYSVYRSLDRVTGAWGTVILQ
jgi:hypothetical protein